jgi:replication-associated recombination protein RarA
MRRIELLNLARGADGDARRALNLLEIAAGSWTVIALTRMLPRS